MSSKVTLGLLCHNEEKNLDLCLGSLLTTENLMHLEEVIVVDNASTDRSFEILQAWSRRFSLLKIFKSEENLVGGARQTILDQCRTEILMFTDADCMVPENWVFSMLQNLKSAEGTWENVAGVCAPNRLPEFYFWQRVINRFQSGPFGHGRSPQAWIPKTPQQVDHLPTTNALYVLRALRSTKGFLPTLMVGEDADMGKQLKALGYKMILFPQPVVVNKSAETFKEWLWRMWNFGAAQWIHKPLRAFAVTGISWIFFFLVGALCWRSPWARNKVLMLFSVLIFAGVAVRQNWGPYHGLFSLLAYWAGICIKGPYAFLKLRSRS